MPAEARAFSFANRGSEPRPRPLSAEGPRISRSRPRGRNAGSDVFFAFAVLPVASAVAEHAAAASKRSTRFRAVTAAVPPK